MKNVTAIKRTIPNIINAIKKSDDITTISYYENIMVSMYASVLLLIAAICNFVIRYLIQSQNLEICIFDSLLFLLLGMAFEVIVRIELETDLVTLIISGLSSVTLILITIRFYGIIGPAVWTVAFIQLLLAMMRISKIMLYFVSVSILISNIYIFYNSLYTPAFHMDSFYYVTQIILFIIVCIISVASHKVNSNRYHWINKQLKEVKEKNTEITSLYEEIACSKEEVKHLAYHDYLTGLPNRLFLSEQLNHAIVLSRRMGKMLAILFLDLNDFKMINDTMGHAIGDQLLIETSKILVDTLRKSDTVVRIGGDEFIILIEDVVDTNYISLVSEKILESFKKPIKLNDKDFFVTTSIGVSIYPRDGENADILIKNADISMYKAKENRNNYL